MIYETSFENIISLNLYMLCIIYFSDYCDALSELYIEGSTLGGTGCSLQRQTVGVFRVRSRHATLGYTYMN